MFGILAVMISLLGVLALYGYGHPNAAVAWFIVWFFIGVISWLQTPFHRRGKGTLSVDGRTHQFSYEKTLVDGGWKIRSTTKKGPLRGLLDEFKLEVTCGPPSVVKINRIHLGRTVEAILSLDGQEMKIQAFARGNCPENSHVVRPCISYYGDVMIEEEDWRIHISFHLYQSFMRP